MITVPVLKKDDNFEQCYEILLGERKEVDEIIKERQKLFTNTEVDIDDLLDESLKIRLNLIGELMDEIQSCIGLLNKVRATEGEINGHFYKLQGRGWEFKKILKIEGAK